jgi:hypothetical protein
MSVRHMYVQQNTKADWASENSNKTTIWLRFNKHMYMWAFYIPFYYNILM